MRKITQGLGNCEHCGKPKKRKVLKHGGLEQPVHCRNRRWCDDPICKEEIHSIETEQRLTKQTKTWPGLCNFNYPQKLFLFGMVSDTSHL